MPRDLRHTSMPPRSGRASSIVQEARQIREESVALENRLSNRSRAGSLAPRSFSRASSMAPVQSTSSYHASSLAPRSLRASSMAPRHEPVVRMVDTSMPLHRFGSRLAVTKADINIKPAIYDEYYGMTYIPSGGRDSWSAYRISDETLDDNDNLVYNSAKRDHDVMKTVNRQIANALKGLPPKPPGKTKSRTNYYITEKKAISVPPPQHTAQAPAYRRFAPKPIPSVLKVRQYNPQVQTIPARYRPVESYNPGYYKVSLPAVRVNYSTVDHGSELLNPKYKVISREEVDLGRPMALAGLKDRLANARTNFTRTRDLYGRNGDDKEFAAINAEVRAIQANRERRSQSVEFIQMLDDHRQMSSLRKNIRSTLRHSRMN